MSRTVSFRASEELDEFLKQEAERRMTTKSTVAQMLVAERVQQLQEESDEPDGEPNDLEAEPSNQEAEPSNSIGEDRDDEPDVFDRHPDKWYRPDSIKHEYAVYTPEDRYNREHSNNQRYYKTRDGAAERLRDWYDE